MGLRRFAAVVAASGVLTGTLWTNRDRLVPQKVKAKTYDLEEAIEQYKRGLHKWSRNWDHRAPAPADQTDSGGEEGKKKEEAKSKAKRHLFLIRHGQYEMWHKDSKLKKLTELGRQQARGTGERLRLLDYDYSILYFSSMPRATETAQIIRLAPPQPVLISTAKISNFSECLPNVPTERCELIREGAPFPPDPPSRSWRPEYSVSVYSHVQ